MRTVGERGPAVVENYQFMEKLERVVHARGTGAHGIFESYGSVGNEHISTFTRAKLFQESGKQTPVFVRFSTVIYGLHSPETLRNPRGFFLKWELNIQMMTDEEHLELSFEQAGERYRTFQDWEWDDLIANIVGGLSQTNEET